MIFVFAVIAAVLVYEIVSGNKSAAAAAVSTAVNTAAVAITSPTDYDQTENGGVPVQSQNGFSGVTITNDPSTWPSGDVIWNVAQAIALAEGYNVAGSNPYRLNNPGDISDGASQFGSESHSGSNVTHFPDAQTGWTWLYGKLQNAASGASKVYHPAMTWKQFAQTWASDWQDWLNNVTATLGVDPNSTFGDYVNA
jgi:hypothetical protein